MTFATFTAVSIVEIK